MTILSSTSRATYTGNGSVSNYSYSFKIFNEDDLLITVRHPTTGDETTLTLTTDYTVTILANGTGSIDLVNASQAWLTAGKLTTSWVIVIRRVVELIQDTDIRNQGSFYPETHENAFDHLMMATQQLKDEIDRSLKIAETDNPLTLRLPTSTERASQFLGFNASGEPIAAGSVAGVPVSAFMQTVLDDADAAAARSTLGLGSISTVNTITTSEITDNTIANGDLRQSAGLSVIGRSANSTGNVADITAANDYDILRRNGTALSFGKLVNKVRSISSADSIVYTDDIIEVSAGSNYNLGVTTTSMIAGQVFKIRRTDNAPTFAVTLNFTINGPLGSGVSYKLHTRGEEYELKYNGTDFDLLNHYTNTGLMGTATVTLTAGTSGTFTLGTTTAKTVNGYRRGRHLVVQLDIRQTGVGTNGTGPCLFTIPYSLTADTTAGGPAYTGTDASVAITSRITGQVYGGSSGGAQNVVARVYLYDSTKFGIVGTFGGTLGIFGSAVFGLGNATTNLNGEFLIPITDWTD